MSPVRRRSVSEVHGSYIPILDFRDEEIAELQWNMVRAPGDVSPAGGLLLRGGRPERWIGIRTWFERRGRHPLIFADLEQGAASQLPGFSWLPSAFSLGSVNDPEIVFRVGSLVGRQARMLGLDGIFGPVADLLLTPDSPILGPRCFGASPDRVASLCAAFIRGCSEQGIMTVAKHFPGHGRSAVDSHLNPVHIQSDIEEWMNAECIPFRKSIEAGCDGIMVGHIWFRGLDPGIPRPASLSPVILRHVLRGRLGFRGAIFTDSLDMGAVEPGDRAIADEALRAGADYVVGVQELHSDLHGMNDKEALPSGRTDPIRSDIETLNNEIDALGRDVAARSLSWINTPGPRRCADDIECIFICTDGTNAHWADQFSSQLSGGLPHVRIVTGPLSALPGSYTGLCILVIGRPVKPRDTHEAIRIINSLQRNRIICVNFGALWVLPTVRIHPVLLGGDALNATQTAAAAVLREDRPISGDPDL